MLLLEWLAKPYSLTPFMAKVQAPLVAPSSWTLRAYFQGLPFEFRDLYGFATGLLAES